MVKLNLGCGSLTPKGWINVDYAIGAKLSKILLLRKFRFTKLLWNSNIYIHNLLKPFPWKNNSVDIIYTSHTLEHFSKEDGLRFLHECYRVLKTGGLIRILVPDLEYYTSEYINGRIKAVDFVEELYVIYPKHKSMFKNFISLYTIFPHKCMYDRNGLLEIINNIGFEAKSMQFAESLILDIKEIENHGRTINSVVIEGIKNN